MKLINKHTKPQTDCDSQKTIKGISLYGNDGSLNYIPVMDDSFNAEMMVDMNNKVIKVNMSFDIPMDEEIINDMINSYGMKLQRIV